MNKGLPLYLETNGEKRLVGTAVPEFDSDGQLVGFGAHITDPTLEGFGRPLAQNPIGRLAPFSIDWKGDNADA